MLDALEQAIPARGKSDDLIHHSDRGCQCLSIRYSERLAEAGITASVSSVGDSYDNALAETINGITPKWSESMAPGATSMRLSTQHLNG